MKGLLQLITEGRLNAGIRRQAAVILSTWGDPRNLEQTVEVPGGRFIMGSAQHPNSNPPHPVQVKGFLMARYPVINRAYLQFVQETDRMWRSTEGRTPERATSPAVDLTWHDANAYCVWLPSVGVPRAASLPINAFDYRPSRSGNMPPEGHNPMRDCASSIPGAGYGPRITQILKKQVSMTPVPWVYFQKVNRFGVAKT